LISKHYYPTFVELYLFLDSCLFLFAWNFTRIYSLLRIEAYPLNAITLDMSRDISNPSFLYCCAKFIMLSVNHFQSLTNVTGRLLTIPLR
jgi:hypothetical protein